MEVLGGLGLGGGWEEIKGKRYVFFFFFFLLSFFSSRFSHPWLRPPLRPARNFPAKANETRKPPKNSSPTSNYPGSPSHLPPPPTLTSQTDSPPPRFHFPTPPSHQNIHQSESPFHFHPLSLRALLLNPHPCCPVRCEKGMICEGDLFSCSSRGGALSGAERSCGSWSSYGGGMLGWAEGRSRLRVRGGEG